MIKNNTVIILVNYNGFDDTRDCICSIKQSIGELPFIVVIDNASTNPNKLELLYKDYELLKIIYNEENIGFGKANNRGIKWAQNNIDFNFLLLLNNDTKVDKNCLTELINPFHTDLNLAIVTGRIFYEFNHNLLWYAGAEISYKKCWPIIHGFEKIDFLKETKYPSKYVSFASGCLMMFSKNSINEFSGFDNDFFMYCEDLELCYRIKQKRKKIFYNHKAVIYHKVNGSSKIDDASNIRQKKKTYYNERAKNPALQFLWFNMSINQYKIIEKYYSGFEKINVVFLYHIKLIYKLLRFLINGRFDMIKCYIKILKTVI